MGRGIFVGNILIKHRSRNEDFPYQDGPTAVRRPFHLHKQIRPNSSLKTCVGGLGADF